MNSSELTRPRLVIQTERRRYLRALAAFYIRMTFRPVDVYELLEPLLKDYRKLRYRNMSLHLAFC
jgi:pre-mRNA-splicing factor 38A